MARKGNQPRKGIDQPPLKSKKRESELQAVADEIPGEQRNSPFTENINKTPFPGDRRKKNKQSRNSRTKDEQLVDTMETVGSSLHECGLSGKTVEESGSRGVDRPFDDDHNLRNLSGDFDHFANGCDAGVRTEKVRFSYIAALPRLKSSALSVFRASCGWLERQKPVFVAVTNNIYRFRDVIQLKLVQTYPVVLKWLFHLGNIVLLVSLVWLDCAYRGMDSIVRMGTTSFLSVLWFSVLSLIAMIGTFKFLVTLAFAAGFAVLVGFTISLLILGVSGAIFLWLYGSFWTTSFAIIFAGLAFILGRERLALLISTVYSVYCAWTYVGWLGVLLGLNLSFISSDALIYFLKNNIDEQRYKASEQADGIHADQNYFTGEAHYSFADNGSGQSADRGAGVASTSGAYSDITSEDEVVRLLNCTDHYSALGLSRYQQVDASVLRREYRKKAMLVHPDKNMGNEKAAEAFKKLQNAYEILLDSLKRKAYDDELRREELLNYYCRFQNASLKNGRHGFFPNGFARSEGDGEDPLAESRRISCKKCGSFHIWFLTKKSKFKARWCQECKDFHQAKDGDGWVEQSSQPLLFGILQKVDLPVAYVCADGKVYDATEWYICQGMRCPANSHKPSFHVNTSITKNGSGKGSTSSHRGGGPTAFNVEENMTEEEFFEWLHNAMQSGMFENFGGGAPGEGNQTGTRNSPKSGSNTGSSSSKRKKKGKKQW